MSKTDQNSTEVFPADGTILPMSDVEQRTILRALRICDWNVAKTAKQLEIAPATIYRKIKSFGIKLPRRSRKACTCKG